MKSRVGRVDRGHKFGPREPPDTGEADVDVHSLIIRPKKDDCLVDPPLFTKNVAFPSTAAPHGIKI